MKNKKNKIILIIIIINLLFVINIILTACNNNNTAKADINVSIFIKGPESVILEEYSITVKDEDTVLTALSTACEENDIELKYSGSGGFAYVNSIGGYKEFSNGSASGWIYMINEEKPNVGIGSKKLSDGDIIRFYFSLNLGADVVWEE
jgi:hypothetical protein